MDIEKYFRASIPLVAVDNPVPEEQSAIEQIAEIGKTLKSPVYFWDLERGLQQISLGSGGVVYSTIDSGKLKNPEPMLQHIRNSKEAGIFILADLDIYFADSTPFTSPAVIRGLKNLCFELKQSNKRVVLLGSNLKLPTALDGLIPIVTNPLPSQQEVEEWLGMILAGVGEARMEGGKRIPVTLTNEDKAKLTRASLGLTREEIHDAVRLCAVTNKTLDRTTPDFVKDVKILKLRKLSIELSEPPTVAIGGQQVIRKWLEQRRVLFDDKVRQRHNLPYPKGVLLVGAPGTGKSLQAKSIGQVLGIPIMRFDIGSIFAGIVGESESNLRTTFKLAEAIAPVVEMLETILISKFPNLTRREIETMLKIDSLRNTRVFQEGVEEGRQEGQQEGELRGQREMLLQFMTLKFGALSSQVVSQIQAVNSTEKLQQLADAIIHSPDLQTFLQNL